MTWVEETRWWGPAIAALSKVVEARRAEAEDAAEAYAQFYRGRRGSMVVDVVASAQRNYTRPVLPLVAKFESQVEDGDLYDLVFTQGDLGLGLKTHAPETMRYIAGGLLTFMADNVLTDEDLAVRQWADSVAGVEHAHRLDTYVGKLSGIGMALFQHIRLRSGADTLKPDLRVRDALASFGFPRTNDPHGLLVMAQAASTSLDVHLRVLDRVLWNN